MHSLISCTEHLFIVKSGVNIILDIHNFKVNNNLYIFKGQIQTERRVVSTCVWRANLLLEEVCYATHNYGGIILKIL